MVIAIDGKWIWDSWYAKDGDTFHGFFLQADRSLGDPDLSWIQPCRPVVLTPWA